MQRQKKGRGPDYSGASYWRLRARSAQAQALGAAEGDALQDARDVLGPVADALEPIVEEAPARVEAELRRQGRQNAGMVFLAGLAVGFVGRGLLKGTVGLAVGGGLALLVASRFSDDRSTGEKLQEDKKLKQVQGYQGVR